MTPSEPIQPSQVSQEERERLAAICEEVAARVEDWSKRLVVLNEDGEASRQRARAADHRIIASILRASLVSEPSGWIYTDKRGDLRVTFCPSDLDTDARQTCVAFSYIHPAAPDGGQ